MHILGISCYYHDAAAGPLRAGPLGAAADVDYVVFYEKPFLKVERIITSVLATFPRSMRVFREALLVLLKEKLWIKDRIRRHLGIDPKRILFVEHHLSHAASAFFCAPFREAAL